MPHTLLIDNWTLQNAGELLCGGLDGETTSDLVFTKNGASYRYDKVSADTVRFEALCQFLNNLVFADNLFVDEMYADAWESFPPIKAAHTAKILVTKPFKDVMDEWIKAREVMADRLCVNSPLLKQHRKNKRTYAEYGKADDGFLSQLVWGGAGMLARADYFRLPYVPHPSRERLFRRASFMLGPSAGARLSEFITSERLKIFKRIDGSGFFTSMHLPPVAVQIIDAASGTTDIIKTALQVRDNYSALRKWLSKFQQALDGENMKEILAHGKALQSVARYVDSYSLLTPVGDTSLQFGLSWLKVGVKCGSPVNAIKNLFGMRAELNRLILAPAGHNSLNKFLRMLGEQHTKRGRVFKDEFLKRTSEGRG